MLEITLKELNFTSRIIPGWCTPRSTLSRSSMNPISIVDEGRPYPWPSAEIHTDYCHLFCPASVIRARLEREYSLPMLSFNPASRADAHNETHCLAVLWTRFPALGWEYSCACNLSFGSTSESNRIPLHALAYGIVTKRPQRPQHHVCAHPISDIWAKCWRSTTLYLVERQESCVPRSPVTGLASCVGGVWVVPSFRHLNSRALPPFLFSLRTWDRYNTF